MSSPETKKAGAGATTPATLNNQKSARSRSHQRASSYQSHSSSRGTSVSKTAGRRINPDSLTTLWFTVILICTLGLCSFMVSFNGLHDVAAWVGLPWWMRWAVPIFIDIAILAYSMAAVIHRARHETVWPTWVTLGAFTAVSVVANAAHALSIGEGQTVVQSWIGAGIAAMAPIAVFAATEQLSRLAFAVDRPAEASPAPEQVPSAATEKREEPKPVATQDPVRARIEAPSSPAERMALAGRPAADRQGTPQVAPLRSTSEDRPVRQFSSPVADQAATTPATPPVTATTPARPVAEVAAEEPKAATAPAATPTVPEAAATSPAAPAAVAEQEKSLPETTAEEPAEEPKVAEKPAGGSQSVVAEDDEFAAWVAAQHAEGTVVTGAMAGKFLNKSERTGRTRLNALKDERPEIFKGAN